MAKKTKLSVKDSKDLLKGQALYLALRQGARKLAAAHLNGKYSGAKAFFKAWIELCVRFSGELPSKSFFNNECIAVLESEYKLKSLIDYQEMCKKPARSVYTWKDIKEHVKEAYKGKGKIKVTEAKRPVWSQDKINEIINEFVC